MTKTIQKVAIKDARFYAPIGFYEEEQLLGNEFYVDVAIYFPFENPNSDQLGNTVNYEELYRILVEVMTPKRKLLESAAEDILNCLVEDYAFITRAVVTIRKTNPPFGGDTAISEVSLEYMK